MDEWPTYPLETFVEDDRSICYGIVQPGAHQLDGHPILRVNNFREGRIDATAVLRVAPAIEEKYHRSRLRGGELLVTLVGTMGLSAIVPREMGGWNVARAVGVVPLKAEVDKRWINFVVRSDAAQRFIKVHANTTVQPTFNLRDLAQLPVPMPPDEIRQAASDLLSALDDKIELNRQTNETLEALARAIFKDWFVDFGPTRAKAEGRAPYLEPALWDLFPDRLDAEGKPEGWDAGSLTDVADLNPESWTKRNAPEAIEYVDLSNTNWGTIDKTEMHSWASAPSRARRILKPGDTIVGTVRPGNGSYAFIAEDGLTGSTGFAVLRPKSRRDRELVWLAATAPENIERLAFLADGAAYPAVRPDVVANTEIVLADQEVIDAFSRTCGSLLDRIEAHKAESRTLARTRDLLLPKLMSGEMRLRDAERMVGEAA